MQDFEFDITTGDLVIRDGDLAIHDSEEVDQYLILSSFPGQWRMVPFIGVGVVSYLGASVDISMVNKFKRDITLHFQMDGFRTTSISLVNGFQTFNVSAKR